MSRIFTVSELAETLGGEVEGEASATISGVASLDEAGPDHLAFLANRRYVGSFRSTRAGAVLIDRETDRAGHTVIRLDDPYAGFARALALFHPLEWPEPRIDPGAHVDPSARLGEVTVEAFAWIGPEARVGSGTWIESGAHVGHGAEIGEDCRLMPGSAVMAGCRLGDRVWLNPGAVVGAEGFGFAPTPEGHLRIPQTGSVAIEDDVDIGANSCVDRGTLDRTVVGRGSKLDNLVQVAHGVRIGEESLLVAFSGVAGSARLGRRVVLAAKAGVANHLTLGDEVQAATGARVLSDQPAGAKVSGYPAIDHARWRRASVAFAKLPELLRRIRRLEARIAELEGGSGTDEADDA